MNGAFRYNSHLPRSHLQVPMPFASTRLIRAAFLSVPLHLFPLHPSVLTFPDPELHAVLFQPSYRLHSGWKCSVSPARFFRVRQSGQDFFVLLNNSTPSIPATTYLPMVPSRNTRLRALIYQSFPHESFGFLPD